MAGLPLNSTRRPAAAPTIPSELLGRRQANNSWASGRGRRRLVSLEPSGHLIALPGADANHAAQVQVSLGLAGLPTLAVGRVIRVLVRTADIFNEVLAQAINGLHLISVQLELCGGGS